MRTEMYEKKTNIDYRTVVANGFQNAGRAYHSGYFYEFIKLIEKAFAPCYGVLIKITNLHCSLFVELRPLK